MSTAQLVPSNADVLEGIVVPDGMNVAQLDTGLPMQTGQVAFEHALKETFDTANLTEIGTALNWTIMVKADSKGLMVVLVICEISVWVEEVETLFHNVESLISDVPEEPTSDSD